MSVDPAPTIVTMVPLTVATAELLLVKVIGRPEVVDALIENAASPIDLAGNGPNVIV